MPWQDCFDVYSKKKLSKIAAEMEASEIKPIVLRWKRAIRGFGTGFQQVHGFLGARTSTIDRLDGQIEFSGKITADAPTAFFPDEFNVAYALVPKCERNLNILAATLNEKNLPWVIESKDVMEEIEALAKKLNPPPEKPEVKPIAKQAQAKKPASKDITIEELVGT